MNRSRLSISRPPAGILLAALALAGTLASPAPPPKAVLAEIFDGRLPNNFPFLNSAGTAATFSTAGFVDLKNPFHVPQGTNGRSCESCHLPQVGWSIRPVDVELKFLLTQGTDPIFNALDANSPSPDVSSLQAKRASYSMLRKGLFRRGGPIQPTFEFEIFAFDDPLGAGAQPTQFQAFRRPLATANFHIAKNIGWHDQNTNGSGDVHAGLIAQAAGNITGSQQGPPATAATLEVDRDVRARAGLRAAVLVRRRAARRRAARRAGRRISRRSSPRADASTCSMPGSTSSRARAARKSGRPQARADRARPGDLQLGQRRTTIAAATVVTTLSTTAAT